MAAAWSRRGGTSASRARRSSRAESAQAERRATLVELVANAATLAQADVVVAAMRDDASARLQPVAVRGTLASLYDRDQSPRPGIDWPAAPGRQASGTLTLAADLGLRPTNPLAPARLHAYRVGTADEPFGVLAIGSADGDAPSPRTRAGLEQALRCASERISRLDAQERQARPTALMAHLRQLRDRMSAGRPAAAASVAHDIAEAAGLTAVWITAVDAAGTAPTVATRGLAPDLLEQLTAPSGPSEVVILHERPLHSDDLAEEPREPWAIMASEHGYGSAYCVPVLQAGVPIGSLGALRTEPCAFEDEELAYFELAAGFLPPLVQQLRGADRVPASDGVATILDARDARDADTWGHARRVAHYAGVIADGLDLEPASPGEVALAATLHDIGKIGVPDAVLRKPGPLTDDEWGVMRTHPDLGYSVLAPMQATVTASLTAWEHQERFDGQGYPRGLAGDAIHPVARIVSVADALDAMTSDRPYRSRISFDGALAEIQDERGRQFDPQAVDALCAAADAGTLRLTSIHDNLGLILRRSGRDPGV